MLIIPYSLLKIVFNIKVGQNTGTSFYMPLKGKHYLVTARHILENLHNESISIYRNGSWETITGNVIKHSNPDIDIAAIEVKEHLPVFDQPPDIQYTTNKVILSSEIFFLGFPYGLQNSVIEDLPGPLIKKAVVSGVLEQKFGFYLDGHNNPGFSGGPCITKIFNTEKWQIFGVVSAYKTQQEVLYDRNGNERMILLENSGLFICHHIDQITQEIYAYERHQDEKD